MSLNQHPQYHVRTQHRPLYGMKGIIVLASSHPFGPSCLVLSSYSTWGAIKNVTALGAGDLDAEFTAVYENIHDNIVSGILATLPDGDWGLNVLRLGFDRDPLKNPITIHLVVSPDGGLSQQMAGNIVADVLEVIAAAPYSSQPIHVDVCCLSESSSGDDHEIFLLEGNPELYDSYARLPYSSVGRVDLNYAGTLSGYIQHRDENGRDTPYALTCRHVIDPHCDLRRLSQATPTLLSVACPAPSDHEMTIEIIETDLQEARTSIDAELLQHAITTLEQTVENAKEYSIVFGNVYATSGNGRLLPYFQGRSDWAIISIVNPDVMAENRHIRSSGSFMSFKHQRVAPLDDDFLRAANQYFAPGPRFKPARDDDLNPGELVFKPRSRTTSHWVGGMFNAIRSTQKSAGVVTREWCFTALPQRGAMSAAGDSGSIIIDQNFQPVAMLWGGGTHGFAYGPMNVTYASPLSEVLRDIEKCMHWTEGSVSFV